jgi:acetoacetate decarboxylase
MNVPIPARVQANTFMTQTICMVHVNIRVPKLVHREICDVKKKNSWTTIVCQDRAPSKAHVVA